MDSYFLSHKIRIYMLVGPLVQFLQCVQVQLYGSGTSNVK